MHPLPPVRPWRSTVGTSAGDHVDYPALTLSVLAREGGDVVLAVAQYLNVEMTKGGNLNYSPQSSAW